jgi:hypothetical protein
MENARRSRLFLAGASAVRGAGSLFRHRFGRVNSVNEEGAMEMKRWLPKAETHPFGTFDIEVSLEEVSVERCSLP